IDPGDEVVGVITYDPASEDASQHTVLVVSRNGFGKRSDPEDYRLTNRGSKGVRTMNVTDKTGKVVAIKNVTPANDLMIITQSGLTIRMSIKDIRETGRAAQGVKLINIREGDSIAAVSAVAASEQEETPTTEINDIESSN
ncbi:MAG: DNA gyrase subunit A, partial [Bacteroidaceae bacterium]|nr:DNA gyrase subunit A [Bacteroidaceae bacterium]